MEGESKKRKRQKSNPCDINIDVDISEKTGSYERVAYKNGDFFGLILHGKIWTLPRSHPFRVTLFVCHFLPYVVGLSGYTAIFW